MPKPIKPRKKKGKKIEMKFKQSELVKLQPT